MTKNLMFDSFWRAAAYCLHPRVIALSFLPLIIMAALSLGLWHFFWDDALATIRLSLDSVGIMNSTSTWLQNMGLGNIKTFLPPVLLVLAVTPVVVVLSLILVAVMMTPAMVAMVAARRFPDLVRKKGGSWLGSVLWSLGATVLAVILLVLSIPLWLVPPLVLILPPLIWGWLTYRVMSFDALADHASKEERRDIMWQHRGSLLVIGVITGYLGAAPTVVWASGVVFAAFFVVLIPVAIWIYTLVFGFASLWFSHYCLAALAQLRTAQADAAAMTAVAAKSQRLPNQPISSDPRQLPAQSDSNVIANKPDDMPMVERLN